MNNTWGYHDAATGNGRYDRYYEQMIQRYGAPSGMEEFCDKMQLMNATGYQGIFEAAQHRLNNNGGIMLWKLNAAFPSVIWQIYDWYLQPNAGYYAMQNSCEPLHVQFNLNDSTVAVVNRKHKAVSNITIEVRAFSLKTQQLFSHSDTINIGEEEVKSQIMSLSTFLSKAMGINFIVLRLKDSSGNVISRNTYWFQKEKDYTTLNQMPKATVQAKTISVDKNSSQTSYTIELTNNSKQLAFFIRAQLLDRQEEMLPSFWSANYVTLAPGESMIIKAAVPSRILSGIQPLVRVSGWNVNEIVIR
jgi:hypothetical protein